MFKLSLFNVFFVALLALCFGALTADGYWYYYSAYYYYSDFYYYYYNYYYYYYRYGFYGCTGLFCGDAVSAACSVGSLGAAVTGLLGM